MNIAYYNQYRLSKKIGGHMKENKAIGVAYYTALGEKNMEKVQEYLHTDIQFIDPQEKIIGKEAVLKAAKGFAGIFNNLTIHSKFGSEDQAMIVYEVEIPGLANPLKAASLLSFQSGLISKIELFYDSKNLR